MTKDIKKKLEMARNAVELAAKALASIEIPEPEQPKQRQNLKQYRRAKYAERYAKY